MLRAAPSIMRMAASMSLAFRSFILISAISRTLARRMVPTLVRPASPLPLSMPDGLLDQVGRGRRLGDEAERAILEDRDQRRDDHARLTGGALVVLLQERHHVDAVLAQRRADGRRWRGFASRATAA